MGMTEQEMIALWEEHIGAEFERKDVEAAMATMTDDPFVINVAVGSGGRGRESVRRFYSEQFLPSLPADNEVRVVRRIVGKNALVDEVRHAFTHDRRMEWLLPGVAPTGRRIDIEVVAIILFDQGKIAGERIYWDHATVLRQAGLL
ncbi:MAG TPA: nuclear transport factor 2 family protein [Terriglobales bacterium]|nr:nuclear transport factor 2 family protein [Terriglobales bacterium]